MKIWKAAGEQHHNIATKALVSAMLLIGLAACGEKKPASASSSQVVAIVDGQEITIHQVNNELAKTGGQQVTKQLLDGLVARQLLINAAKKDKLDTDPAVLAGLAPRYHNDALGDMVVTRKDGKAWFDVGAFKSEVVTMPQPDGSVALVTIDPVAAGFLLVRADKDGQRRLVVRDGQHEYVFDAAQ